MRVGNYEHHQGQGRTVYPRPAWAGGPQGDLSVACCSTTWAWHHRGVRAQGWSILGTPGHPWTGIQHFAEGTFVLHLLHLFPSHTLDLGSDAPVHSQT